MTFYDTILSKTKITDSWGAEMSSESNRLEEIVGVISPYEISLGYSYASAIQNYWTITNQIRCKFNLWKYLLPFHPTFQHAICDS